MAESLFGGLGFVVDNEILNAITAATEDTFSPAFFASDNNLPSGLAFD